MSDPVTTTWVPTGRIAMIGRNGRAIPCQEWEDATGTKEWRKFPLIEVDELQFAGLQMMGLIRL